VALQDVAKVPDPVNILLTRKDEVRADVS
jgi:hypothetical protein